MVSCPYGGCDLLGAGSRPAPIYNVDMPKIAKIAFYALGCKLNQYELRAIQEGFEARGWEFVPFGEEAEVYLVHTCAVTGRSARQSRQMILRAKRLSPKALVVATGCYAEVAPEELRAVGTDLVIGTSRKEEVVRIVEEALGRRPPPVSPLRVSRFPDRSRALLKVQDGCDRRCTYCIVPLARGPSRSRPLEEVVREAERLARAGHLELVLTGVDLGSYGKDLTPPVRITDLLEALEEVKGPRFRLSSLEPMGLSEDLLDLMARSDRFCRHLHLPLQSGDEGILKAMGRPYRPEEYRAWVEEACRRIPDICIGADVIVGFPGEDDVAFENTVRLLEDLPVAYLHVFPFSPRPGTRAYRMRETVGPEEKRRRAKLLRDLGERKRREFYRNLVGKELEVLMEDRYIGGKRVGLSDNYARVVVDAPEEYIGRIVRVRPLMLDGGVLVGMLHSPKPYVWVVSPNHVEG